MTMLARGTAAVVLLMSAMRVTACIEREDLGARAEMRFMYLPSSEYLNVSSLGYRTVLADVIFLWAIQYYGDYSGRWHKRFDYLWHIYDVITDLDVKFEDAYYFGSFVMAYDAEETDMAVALLEKGARNFPEEWFFYYQAGFLLYEQGRFEEAAKFYRLATERGGMSVPARRLHAAMLSRAGRYEDALRLWQQICVEADNVWIRQIAMKHIFQNHVSRDSATVGRVAADYRARHGRFPPSLVALVREGLLPAVPRDPYGEPYTYDFERGEIACRSAFSVLRSLPSCSPDS